MYKVYKKSLKDEAMQEVEVIGSGCWVNIVNPSKEELEMFANNLNLERDILEDVYDENELS